MAAGAHTTNDPTMPARPPAIEGYGGGGFRVDGAVYTGSLIVLPACVVSWDIVDFAQISETSLPPDIFADASVELLLLGCGGRHQMVPRALRDAIRAVGTVIEPMDTGAAVRTYNILLGENRHVAAALIAVD